MKVKAQRFTKNRLRKAGINPVRITNPEGKRVWIVNGKEYINLAQVADAFKVHSTFGR